MTQEQLIEKIALVMINRYIAIDKFSIADIDAYVTYKFAKWIKIDASLNRTNIKKWLKKVCKPYVRLLIKI